jgi:hypothetical protein
MEVFQTFDGNSAPVKKTTINRWEEYINEEWQVQEEATTIYYLRSTALGGKVIVELDSAGYKRVGYVFAGGMRIATHYVWSNSGPSSVVERTSASPATGSEYMIDGSYMVRKELDPLGADVTTPPSPSLITEPIFYNPRFDQMPLEIEGGPSEEYTQANRNWDALMAETFQAIHDRAEAEKLWQAGKRDEALAILQKNPNVGIEYRALAGGKIVKSGSYFGQDAADFLVGLSMAVDAGFLSPVVGTRAEIGQRHHPLLQAANAQNTLTATVYFWAPGELANIGKGPVGHLSVRFSNGIYISAWPLGGTGAGGTILDMDSEVQWQPSYESDKNSYGRDADLSTKVGNIDAAAINDYWAFIRKNPGTWRNGRHCADIVAEALSYAGVVLNNTQPGMSVPREVLYIIQRDARRYKREKLTPIWKSNFKSILNLRRVYD